MAAKLMLSREFHQLKTNPQSADYYIHDLEGSNIFKWIVVLFGPQNTCFAGATFKAIMRFSDEYPHSPPSLQFLSPIFHPNVFRDGKVCISTLQVPAPGSTLEQAKLNWSAVLGVHGALQSVVSLFSDMNTSDAANPAAAALYIQDRAEFDKRVMQTSRSSNKDLPEGFIRPIIVSPIANQHDTREHLHLSKHMKPGSDSDESYHYSSDDMYVNDDGNEDEEEPSA